MNKKNKTKRIIALICIVTVVGLLAAMPLIAKQDPEQEGPKASILSGTAAVGSIDTRLIGGGTLTESDAVTVSVPSAVKLTGFLVSNGQTVTEGTALAEVDRVTVMTAISQVQETLEYLSEQIEEESDVDSEETVTALAGGTVKILYAEEGETVQSVMLEHGALAVLSLDGLMAVDLQTDSARTAGTAVTVTLSDGVEAAGKITRNLAGEMTVTVEDDGYAVGEAVQITAEDGTALGSGELYIYSPWNATAYAGNVDTVKVSVGDTLDAGDALMVLTDVGYSAAYRQLVGQRQEYEQLMLELFEMYQTQTVTAPCDGVVSGIDEDSAQMLSDDGQGYTLSLLANAPNGDDEMLYFNYLGKVTAVATNGWVMNVDPQAITVADYMDLSGVTLDETRMTQTVLHTQTEIPVFTLTEGAWTLVERDTVGAGDILLFAGDSEGNLIWSVLVQKAQQQPEGPGDTTDPEDPDRPGDPSDPGTGTEPGTPTTPGGSQQPGTNTDPGTSTVPGGSTIPTTPGGTGTQTTPSIQGGTTTPNFSYPSGGSSSFGDMGGMMEQESAFELYGLDMAQIALVTPQNAVSLEITVDEQDVTALQTGMTAQVRIDALGGEKYTATVTDIGNTGTNNGGSSKYTVTLTLDRAENMLSGMNATATIVLSTAADTLTVSADALVEQGNQTVIYTGYDEENGVLLNPVTVTVGSSDGQTVEILEGLADGQTYYYAYYDTLEVSYTPDFGGMGGGFMFG